jgi:hypothetical protein
MLPPVTLPAAEDRPGGGSPFAPAFQQIAGVRRLAGCAASPTDDSGRELSFRGRPAIEVTGRAGGVETIVDTAVFDVAARRIVAYTCLANASARRAGEAIVSMSEISSRADKLALAIVPGANLALESIRRRREGDQERVYYEARYAPPPGSFPFFEPPVRLLLNASTGSLFSFDIDPDWLDPAAPARNLISKKGAERIAAAVLRTHDLAPALGRGATVGKVAAADLFTVRPNGWMGFYPDDPESRARVAWVVLFWPDGGDAPGPHNLFVDAATGRILGGQARESAGPVPR